MACFRCAAERVSGEQKRGADSNGSIGPARIRRDAAWGDVGSVGVRLYCRGGGVRGGRGTDGQLGRPGDGTYRNPILNADYPDVDVEQAGDTYYMISSKQHLAPGMVILASKDMVNWTTIGHVWPRLSWAPEYNWDRMAGYPFGVWAGDLAYHEGRWYLFLAEWTGKPGARRKRPETDRIAFANGQHLRPV